jgi:hypothetical protein
MKNESNQNKMNKSTMHVYVLVLSVDYEGDRVYGIYDTLAYAEKAKETVLEEDDTIEYGAELWIKEVKMNQAPTFDFLWGYIAKQA